MRKLLLVRQARVSPPPFQRLGKGKILGLSLHFLIQVYVYGLYSTVQFVGKVGVERAVLCRNKTLSEVYGNTVNFCFSKNCKIEDVAKRFEVESDTAAARLLFTGLQS